MRKCVRASYKRSSLQHPPPARTRGGDAKCGPTLSQRQGAQLPVDPDDVRRRRRARLGAFPGGRHHRRRDEARSAVAMKGPRRSTKDGLEALALMRSLGRTRRCGGRTRRRASALESSSDDLYVVLGRRLRRRARIVMRSVALASAARRRPEVGSALGVWRRGTRMMDESGRGRRGARP